jgi:hypothetical protein
MALAVAWQDANDLPAAVRRVLDESSDDALHDLELLLAIPEHKVPLPGGARSSQTDLFALARGRHGLVAIAVEGKVEESFDETVEQWLRRRGAEQAKKGRSNEPSAQARERLRFLCGLLQLEAGNAGDLHYQLLHRTVSALLEARRFGAPAALMLVHSFSTGHARLADYRRFAARLGAGEAGVDAVVSVGTRDGISLSLGWVAGLEASRKLRA